MTSREAHTLTTSLEKLAGCFARQIRPSLLDTDDLMQEARMGLLGGNPAALGPLTIARRRIIDALRVTQDARYTQRNRQREVLMPDFPRLVRQRFITGHPEDWRIRALDIKRFAAHLTPREQIVFWGRYQGYYHWEIAERLQRTEGRACQMEKAIIAKLKEAA